MKTITRTKTLFIVWLLVILSFCTVHLTGDFECFIAWARMTSNNGVTSISSLSDVWELKGILLRAIFLVLYKISSLFASDVTLEFHFIYKFFGTIGLNLILACAIFLFPSKYIGDKFNRKDYFFLVGIVVFAVHFASHLQAEFIAVPILVLATSLYLRDNLCCKFLSGILIGLTFFLKSPIPIMGGSVFFIAMLLKKNSFIKELVCIIPLGIAMLLTIGIGVLILAVYSPQEIQDILDASTFQQTLLSNPSAIKDSFTKIVCTLTRNVWYNVGVGLLFLCITHYILQWKREKAALYIILSALFPCAYILLSNCYFEYHCYLLIYPALFAVLYYIVHGYEGISKKEIFFYLVILLFALLLNPWAHIFHIHYLWLSYIIAILCILSLVKIIRPYICHCMFGLLLVTFVVNGSAISASAIRSNIEYNKFLKESTIQGKAIGESISDDSILYLDGGSSSYFCRNVSYLRYFYPLPIQRIDEQTSSFVNTSTFTDVMGQIQAYDNTYILINEGWFFMYPHQVISVMLNNRFVQVEEVKLPSYSWNLFCWNQLEYSNTKIYKNIKCNK